jgi:hypothetical protein
MITGGWSDGAARRFIQESADFIYIANATVDTL